MSDEAGSEGLLSEPTAGEVPINDGSYKIAVADDGKFSEGWQELLTKDDNYADAAKTVERFKSLPELAKGYAELYRELSRKAEKTGVPGKDATPEEINKYREALGVPASIDDYQFKPEDIPDDQWDKEEASIFREIFHRHNIPPSAAQELAEARIKLDRGRADSDLAAQQGEVERNRAELQAEFGSEFTTQIDLARRFAITAGADPNDPAFNNAKVVKALAFAGRNIGEDRMVPSAESGGMNSGHARAKDIAQNPANPLHARYRAGDPDAVAMVQNLLKGKI